jgi:hypothetical protein
MSELLDLPPALQGIFFDFRWETVRAWALLTPVEEVPLASLVWHFDLTVWTTVPGEPRFDLAPSTVLANPGAFPMRWRKIKAADTSYALEMLENGGRWVILDGYHRLARHWLSRAPMVPVRRHPPEARAAIRLPSGMGAPAP